jgi:hypothetical protein
MTNTNRPARKSPLSASVRKFNAGARKIDKMIEAYAAGTEIDWNVVARPIYNAVTKLTCGHKSAQWAVIAEHGAESLENEACQRWVSEIYGIRMAAALESAIANRENARREEIARLNDQIRIDRANRYGTGW